MSTTVPWISSTAMLVGEDKIAAAPSSAMEVFCGAVEGGLCGRVWTRYRGCGVGAVGSRGSRQQIGRGA